MRIPFAMIACFAHTSGFRPGTRAAGKMHVRFVEPLPSGESGMPGKQNDDHRIVFARSIHRSALLGSEIPRGKTATT